jgi:diguanylate cyclase (GGDEF)-like protein
MTQKVLIIDDSSTIHAVIKSKLSGESIEFHSASNGRIGLELAASVQPDLILLDVEMPQPNGFDVCRLLKADAATTGIPIIFLTGASTTEEKIKGLELGAVDYVTKPFDAAELRARVRASLRTKYLLDLLSKKAQIDGLTGLWNRTYMDQRLESELALCARRGTPFSCIMADADHFKRINDTFGHACGDVALRSIGQVFSENCRTEDVVCRYGGEEFAILLPGIESEGAMTFAQRLRELVEQLLLSHRGQQVKLTCSFGIATVDSTDSCDASPIVLADQALYQAKKAGRNRVAAAKPSPREIVPASQCKVLQFAGHRSSD